MDRDALIMAADEKLLAECELLRSPHLGRHSRLRPNLVDELPNTLGLRLREESRVPDLDRHGSNHGRKSLAYRRRTLLKGMSPRKAEVLNPVTPR